MKRETIDSYTKWSARPFKALAHIDADVMIDFAEYFADEQLKKEQDPLRRTSSYELGYHDAKEQLKKKMPSESKIQTGLNLANEIYFDGSKRTQRTLVFGAKWLKQQILKP